VTTNSIAVQWNDNSGNEQGFKVERRQNGGGWAQITMVGAGSTSYTSGGLNSGTQYCFRVRAYNSGGDSGYSNETCASTSNPAPQRPNAPSNARLGNVTTNSMTLYWNDNSNNEQQFKIERRNGGSWSHIATVGANTASYTSSGLSAGTQYCFRVRAYNSAGDSGYSNEPCTNTSMPPPQRPNVPSNARLGNATTNSMTFYWNDNSNNEQGFKVERRQNGGGWSHIATVGASSTSYTSSGLNSGTQYCFRVRAYNSAGDSGYSNEPCATASKKRVGLQAGHWKVNELPAELAWGRSQTGTSGGGTTEWQVALNVASLAANLLRQRGYDIDVLPATVPEQYKPDAFISLHTDGNKSSQPNGYKASRSYYTTNIPAGDRLVSAIYAEYGKSTRLAVATNITDDMRYYFAFNYGTYKHAVAKDVPAAILEMGYLTSPTDQQILVKNQNLAAEGVANAISAFFK
jgi:N-acetylmuramoyl-L-alanine amidase